jgi:hypothetical protein
LKPCQSPWSILGAAPELVGHTGERNRAEVVAIPRISSFPSTGVRQNSWWCSHLRPSPSSPSIPSSSWWAYASLAHPLAS